MNGKFFRKESPSGMLFGIASILGLVFTIVSLVAALHFMSIDLGAITLIISLGIVNGILALICIVLSRDSYNLLGEKTSSQVVAMEAANKISALSNELNLEKEKIKGVAFHLHNIHDQLRDRIVELQSFYQTLITDANYIPEQSDIIDVIRITKQFNLFLVNNIKDIYDYLTGHKCCVCIKIIGENDDGDLVVSTLMRDTSSYRERKSNDGLLNLPFLWYENTAFKLILSNDTTSSYYVCDDLTQEQTYTNINKNWKKFYSATLVVPIRINLSDPEFGEGDLNVTGFICIDNHGGGFNTPANIEIIAGVADSLYQYFNITALVTDLATSRIRENASKNKKCKLFT